MEQTNEQITAEATQQLEQQQTQATDWLEDEEKTLSSGFDGEALPSLKLESGKITKFEVDFTLQFEKWQDRVNGITKAIIPVIHQGVKKNLWLNIKNPLYKDLIKAGRNGQSVFLVSTVGSQKETRYSLQQFEELTTEEVGKSSPSST
tara:strand:+ start:7153 stop:7596 length:444 start_codon:yes stop_codon:yes gene_type:complete